jgi:tetratricopeptide (TPR) repeat protein
MSERVIGEIKLQRRTAKCAFSNLSSLLLRRSGAILLAAALAPGAGAAEPYTPRDDAEVLERLPVTVTAEKSTLRRLRSAFERDPGNFERAAKLAWRYIAVSRAESDPRYRGYAQAVLARWWNLAHPPSELLVLRATLYQARHDFDHALADLSQLLSRDPRNAQAWLTRAVILQVRGEYAEAKSSCSRLRVLAESLVSAACIYSVAGRNGNGRDSYRRLRLVLQARPNSDARLRLWILAILAEMAAGLGEPAAAENYFRQALALRVRDAYLLNAYADFLLDRGDPAKVIDLMAAEARADGSLLRLALAEKRLDTSELGDHIAALEARFAASRRRGDAIHLREEARFTLHLLQRPQRALELAIENWRVQREPWDARLVLEAAIAVQTPSAAAPVLQWLSRSHLENVRIQALVEQLEAKDQL